MEQIEAIPADCIGIDLANALDPVLTELASIDPPKAKAYLDIIRGRHGLDVATYRSYERGLQERRKAKNSAVKSGEAAQQPPEYSADFPDLVDIVDWDGSPAFLVLTDEGPALTPSTSINGVQKVPPPMDNMPWLLPRAEEVLRYFDHDTDTELFRDLAEYHARLSELPDARYYKLLAAWDMHTYLMESFNYSPYMWLFAVPERGKSRTGKAMTYVAHRGIHVESVREAYILRAAQDLKATLFFDVMDLSKKLDREGSEDILLLRFEKGGRVPRVLYPDRGPHQDTVYYSIFGPTIIGTNEPIHPIMETRSVSVTMPLSTRVFEEDLTPEMGRPFRERLVAFRARHLGRVLPSVEKPARSRLGDILKPLFQVTMLVAPEEEANFRSLVADFQKDRLAQRAESLESRILEAVASLEDCVQQGILAVSAIVGVLNAGKPDKEKVTPHRIGRRLAALGFRKARTSGNAAAIVWDDGHLDRTMAAYGLVQVEDPPAGVSGLSNPDFDESPAKVRAVSRCEQTPAGLSGHSGLSPGVCQADFFDGSMGDDESDEEERAAILEFDADLPRKVAEARAGIGAETVQRIEINSVTTERWQHRLLRRGMVQ